MACPQLDVALHQDVPCNGASDLQVFCWQCAVAHTRLVVVTALEPSGYDAQRSWRLAMVASMLYGGPRFVYYGTVWYTVLPGEHFICGRL